MFSDYYSITHPLQKTEKISENLEKKLTITVAYNVTILRLSS